MEVEELSGAYAYSIDDVVEYKQGSSGIPQELWQRKKEFEDAFYQRDKQSFAKGTGWDEKSFLAKDNTEVKRAEAKNADEKELGTEMIYVKKNSWPEIFRKTLIHSKSKI